MSFYESYVPEITINAWTVPTILRKWNACQDQVRDAELYFQQLCARVGPQSVKDYTKLEDELQRDRLQDVTVMDAFDVRDKDGE